MLRPLLFHTHRNNYISKSTFYKSLSPFPCLIVAFRKLSIIIQCIFKDLFFLLFIDWVSFFLKEKPLG
jgi:hypothetical protein